MEIGQRASEKRSTMRALVEDVGLTVASYGLLVVVLHYGLKLEDSVSVAHLLWWYPFVVILVVYSGVAAWRLRRSRWTGVCPESQAFLRLYVAAQLLAIPIELLDGKLPIVLHHVVSIVGFAFALETRRCHFFCAAAGLSEISTIFLEGVLVAKRFPLTSSWFLMLNGTALWLSYIFCRLLLFPVLLGIYVDDRRRLAAATYKNARAGVVLVPTALTILFLLSCSWFTRIHKGFVTKVLGAS